MKPFLQRLAKIAPTNVHAYPNAGLPNAMGEYDETPEEFANNIKQFAIEGLVNMVGGCCGSTPIYIKALADAVRGIPRRQWATPMKECLLSGMQEFIYRDNLNFVNVGERCNIAGSIQFKNLIKKGKYEDAIEVAKAQVENGAQIIDVNLDDGLIDGVNAMRTFCNMAQSNPDIA